MVKDKQLEQVHIYVGSKDTDWPVVEDSGMLRILNDLHVSWRVSALSAHRHRKDLEVSGRSKMDDVDGPRLFILAAGMSAALPGDFSSIVGPGAMVFGVALRSEVLEGMDALMSMVRMPKGMPVCVMGIGKHALCNAGWSACNALALSDPAFAHRLKEYHASKQPGPLHDFNRSHNLEPQEN